MASSLRHIRRRIKSVEGTKKMTHAMEMVATSKLKRLRDLLAESDRYILELSRILSVLVREKPLAHPLLEKRGEVRSTLVFLITSDAGLCGSYNANLLSKAEEFIEAQGARTNRERLKFIAVGKTGGAFLKRHYFRLAKQLPIPRPQQVSETVTELSTLATQAFMNRKADEVSFVYTRAETLSSLKPRIQTLFPVRHETSNSKERRQSAPPVDYLAEPDLNAILDVLLPEYIQAEVGQMLKHALVSEQASRMMAMRQATENAKEMIESLTLQRNKMRQAAITKELIEVVTGSRALRNR